MLEKILRNVNFYHFFNQSQRNICLEQTSSQSRLLDQKAHQLMIDKETLITEKDSELRALDN